MKKIPPVVHYAATEGIFYHRECSRNVPSVLDDYA